jgi:hypothetical protein
MSEPKSTLHGHPLHGARGRNHPHGSMKLQRLVLAVSCLVVAALAVLFVVLQWERANKVATVVSCLAAVTAVGVAIWAALPGRGGRVTMKVRDAGRATSGQGGTASTGIKGPAAQFTGDISVERTGDADASTGGDANTGIQLY